MKLLTILASVGAINWGLVAVFDFNLVEALLGEGSILTSAVYIVVGVAGILLLTRLCKCSKGCSKKCKKSCAPCKDGTCAVHEEDSSKDSE